MVQRQGVLTALKNPCPNANVPENSMINRVGNQWHSGRVPELILHVFFIVVVFFRLAAGNEQKYVLDKTS
jgi:hypothetical protein